MLLEFLLWESVSCKQVQSSIRKLVLEQSNLYALFSGIFSCLSMHIRPRANSAQIVLRSASQ
jgi:hypothetical protein